MRLPEFDWRYFFLFVAALAVLWVGISVAPEVYTSVNPDMGRVGIIKLNGPITQDADLRSPGITPGMISSLTQDALQGQADVIIYEINSPGGTVVASKDAARLIRETEVPTVCLMKEVAASGGYWLAAACDHIVADSLSVTGSIGVTSSYLEFSDLLERYGVEYVNLTSGEYKEMGSIYQDLSEEEAEKFQGILDTVHDSFIESISRDRNLSRDHVASVATGEVYLGKEAQELELVDTLGSRDTALAVAKNMTGVSTLKEKEYKAPQRFDMLSFLFSSIGEGIVDGLKSEKEYGLNAR